jgi:hypothetical protein
MSSEPIQADRRFFTRWVGGTFAGWALGFVISMLLLIAGELTGMPGDEFVFGIGMGAGVGYIQGRVAREWLGATRPWVWGSVAGLGVSFLAFDIMAAVWNDVPNLIPGNLDAAVFGGLFVGLLQRRILRSHSDKANWWVPSCVVGWTLAALMPDVAIFGMQPADGNLIQILMGGGVLGIVTGGALVWILRHPKSTVAPTS